MWKACGREFDSRRLHHHRNATLAVAFHFVMGIPEMLRFMAFLHGGWRC